MFQEIQVLIMLKSHIIWIITHGDPEGNAVLERTKSFSFNFGKLAL